MAPSGEAKPMLGMVRHVVVAESDREALELAGPAYNRWSGALTYLHRDRGAPVPPMLEVPFLDAQTVASASRDRHRRSATVF
jgi:hypothetical protein